SGAEGLAKARVVAFLHGSIPHHLRNNDADCGKRKDRRAARKVLLFRTHLLPENAAGYPASTHEARSKPGLATAFPGNPGAHPAAARRIQPGRPAPCRTAGAVSTRQLGPIAQ